MQSGTFAGPWRDATKDAFSEENAMQLIDVSILLKIPRTDSLHQGQTCMTQL